MKQWGHELLNVVGCTHNVMPASVPHTLSTTKLYYMPCLFFTSISICYSPKPQKFERFMPFYL